ncbi:hypothetical protein [Streptosporangium sp. NPDC023615]|uniref:hypothetical protein n=1 Tax=Streptosporangium sp. NPDC023615 TaxID=3154794 RepID=UPI00341877B1
MGPAGPPGPAGAAVLTARSRGSIATSLNALARFTAFTSGNGTTSIRDPRTDPSWHDITSVPGYPGTVTQVELESDATDLHVTVLTATGTIAHTTCLVRPVPGTLSNPAWPGNCGAFTDVAPPT